VVLFTEAGLTAGELWQRLSATGLPRLWLPKRENIFLADVLPMLATGKLDLRAVKAKAEELACAVV